MADDAFDPDDIPELDQPEPEPFKRAETPVAEPTFQPPAPPPSPVNWNLITAHQAEEEWMLLNGWVNWLRATYGLPAATIPPMWHRHWELIWELSALHTHWLTCYHPTRDGSAPLLWHADFAAACARLRNWVTINGSKLDRDRPTRQTTWPGEDPVDDGDEEMIVDRDEDFVNFVVDDVQQRAAAEAAKEAARAAQHHS
ncbi:hypothetical protein ACIGCK_12390 [Microbacterium sp. NPDC078428]|uniref:hypothetical protein n=1 Tax=Microbacterium sp. NPDC078428 TaxID=3364190 RepID=UPI0037CC35C3